MRRTTYFSNLTTHKQFLLPVLDVLFSSLIIAPAVIVYWRGTWCLSDLYIFPNDLCISLIVSGVFGTLVQLGFALFQDYFEDNIRLKNHWVFYLIARVYTYLHGMASVNLWRGGWKALDFFCGTELVRVCVITVLSFAVVAYLKTTRNLLSAPYLVVIDSKINYFKVPTIFKLEKNSELLLYVLDCFFSVFIIGSLVVFIWRGVWCLTDVFLFPENENYSALSSLAIGYALVLILFSLQNLMENLCEKLTGFWRLLVVDIYVFVSFVGTINLWRGIWHIFNIYFLPEFPILGYWISHLGCFAFLVLIKCSNTILTRGVYLDGEGGSKCVVFPTFYFTFFFEEMNKNQIENKETNLRRDSHDEKVNPSNEELKNSKTNHTGEECENA